MLTVAEVRELLQAAETDLRPQRLRGRALLGLLATLALRVGEAIGLDVGRLRHNAGDRLLMVVGEGGRTRELPVPATLGRHIDAYLTERRRAAARAAAWDRYLTPTDVPELPGPAR